MSAVRQAEIDSVFDWNPARPRRRALVGCIAGSAILHALCFYLFQIIYPPTVALLPPPARVHMITPGSEDGRLLLQWIEAEDPALSSTTQRPANAAAPPLPTPQYVASFANHQPALRELPPLDPDFASPSARPPAPVPQPRASAAPPKVATATTITLRESDTLGSITLPPLQFTSSRSEPPAAAEFRIGVDEYGVVRHCFLEQSSGEPALDEQARRYLLLGRFAHPPESLAWTTATIEWGNDLARANETAR